MTNQRQTINKTPYQLIDLTHPLMKNMPSWEGGSGFTCQNQLDYSECTTSVKFRVQQLNMHAGMGTHMDAPAHCVPGGKTIDALSIAECFLCCVVIDISEKADETYRCSIDDIMDFESKFGVIEEQSFVIIRTGWDRYWSTPEKYPGLTQNP